MLRVHNRLNKLQSYTLPSNSYINLTLGPSGAQYTAPVDGWFLVTREVSLQNITINIEINNGIFVGMLSTSVQTLNCLAPIKKGDLITVRWSGNSLGNYKCRAYYALGSEPQT